MTNTVHGKGSIVSNVDYVHSVIKDTPAAHMARNPHQRLGNEAGVRHSLFGLRLFQGVRPESGTTGTTIGGRSGVRSLWGRDVR